jgi:hypothetical protein
MGREQERIGKANKGLKEKNVVTGVSKKGLFVSRLSLSYLFTLKSIAKTEISVNESAHIYGKV